VDAVETLMPQLGSLHGAIRIPRMANIDRQLNTLKGVSVRTEQILEESYPVQLIGRSPIKTRCDIVGSCLESSTRAVQLFPERLLKLSPV